MSSIDLHMHSHYSDDGEFSPAELMEQCCAAGLKTVALTDHNSIKGNREAAERGKELGLDVVPAVELDCQCRGVVLHLLGYGFHGADAEITRLEDDIARQAEGIAAAQMKMLHEMGLVFEESRVAELAAETFTGLPTAEMIAEVILEDKHNLSHPLVQPFLPGGPRSDNPCLNFYWDLCSPGKPVHVPLHVVPFEEANELILRHGGKTVVAHPSVTVGRDEDLIAHMVERGVTGIEVYCSYHNLDDVAYYTDLARRLGLFASIGSDYHGKTKPTVFLGKVPGKPDEEALLRALNWRAGY